MIAALFTINWPIFWTSFFVGAVITYIITNLNK